MTCLTNVCEAQQKRPRGPKQACCSPLVRASCRASGSAHPFRQDLHTHRGSESPFHLTSPCPPARLSPLPPSPPLAFLPFVCSSQKQRLQYSHKLGHTAGRTLFRSFYCLFLGDAALSTSSMRCPSLSTCCPHPTRGSLGAARRLTGTHSPTIYLPCASCCPYSKHPSPFPRAFCLNSHHTAGQVL